MAVRQPSPGCLSAEKPGKHVSKRWLHWLPGMSQKPWPHLGFCTREGEP